MAIKQIINYNSNAKYFAGFLQTIIDESEIKASVSQDDTKIELLLDDSDEKALATFSKNTTKYLPHSIFIDDIKSSSEAIDVIKSEFKSPSYNISLCPKCLSKITDPSSQNYLDDSIKCTHYTNIDSKEFFDNTIFSPNYSDGDTLLVVDSQSVNNLFLMTEDEVKTLFSIEKPILKVTIKDEELKEITSKKFLSIKSPYNSRSTLVALNAKESEVPYLFFKAQRELKAVVIKKDVNIIKDDLGLTKQLKEQNADKIINRFLNIKNEAGYTEAIGTSFSLENGLSFLVSNEMDTKKVITLQEFILSEVLDLMQEDGIKQKLLQNFEKTYPEIFQELKENSEYNFFEALSCILELDNKSFESLSDKSLEFHGNGGLKIDTNFTDEGFDYGSFLGSVMSFKLAGVDEHYLAYSIFEAFGDMAITTLNQLKTKFKIDKFIMMGSMFENSVLHSRIITKFQLSNPYFSKAFALDD